MFEQSVVESTNARSNHRRAITLPISIALHVVAVSGALFAAVWNVEFPLNVPSQLEELTRMDIPVPPKGNEGRPKQETKPEVKPATATPNIPPTIIPDTPLPQIADNIASDPISPLGSETTDEGTDPNGVQGGEPGSVGDALPVEEPRQILTAGGDVKAPVVISRPTLDYPPLAAKMRLEGTATVECIIDRDGNIQSVKTIYSNHPLFRAAAEESVKKWKFRPGTLNGQPVDVMFNLTVKFAMNR